MLKAEYQVLLCYLKNCGFLEMGFTDYELFELASALRGEWHTYQVVLRTLSSKSYEVNMVSRPEESTLHGSYESVAQYIAGSRKLLHPQVVIE